MALFGDFSEEGIAKGVAALVDQRAAALVDARLAQAMQPLQQREQLSAQQAHENAIYAAHADADEIADSAEFKQWVDAQPAFARAAVANVLQNGSAAEIVEVFSTFKGAKPAAAPAASPAAPANAVDAAVAKAKAGAEQAVPVSLSELTGAAAGASEAERVQALADNPAALINVMSGMTPAKLDALMNSVA
jgi:Meckel syndrome type 1 protein